MFAIWPFSVDQRQSLRIVSIDREVSIILSILRYANRVCASISLHAFIGECTCVCIYDAIARAERKYTFMAMSYEYMVQWCMHHLVALIKLI